jgi:hypothetical protein
MPHALARVRSFQIADSKCWSFEPLTRAQIEIWAAESTCAWAPHMSATTLVSAEAGARLVRWCRESLNASTCLEVTRVAFPFEMHVTEHPS